MPHEDSTQLPHNFRDDCRRRGIGKELSPRVDLETLNAIPQIDAPCEKVFNKVSSDAEGASAARIDFRY